jgi:hypothetical protein
MLIAIFRHRPDARRVGRLSRKSGTADRFIAEGSTAVAAATGGS